MTAEKEKIITQRTPLTTWQIFWICLGSLLVLLTPLWFYIGYLAKLGVSNEPEHWGQFGDFIGGILNPVIGLLTLAATIIIAVIIRRIDNRNHHENVNSTVKPYFTIGSSEFFSANTSTIGLTVEQDFYSYKPPTAPAGPQDHFNKQFHLKVFNKGLGTATEVLAKFEINLAALKELLTFTHQHITVTTTDISTDEVGRSNMWLNIKSTKFNYKGVMKLYASENKVLGEVENKEKVKCPVPSQLLSAFQLYNLKRRLITADENFPDIRVTLMYKNIHGEPLESKFRVGLFNIQDYAHFSRYRLLQEPI